MLSQSGKNGLDWPCRLNICWIKASQRLLGDAAERQSLRSAARSEAERWGWAGATEQLRGYYRQVLDQPQLTAA